MVQLIQAEVSKVDFWSSQNAQRNLHSRIVIFLDKNRLVDFEQLDDIADQLLKLAEAIYENR